MSLDVQKDNGIGEYLFYGAAVSSLFIIAAVFWPTLAALHVRWSRVNEAYSHGYLVLLMFIWLVGIKIRDAGINPNPSFIPLLFLLPSSLLWTIAYVTNIQLLEQLMLPLILWGWVACILGVSGALKFYAPFLLCYLAIPLWDFLVLPLRHAAVFVVQEGLGVLAIPAMIDGFNIYLSVGTVVVAGGCSGLNYFMVGMALGAANAYLSADSFRARMIIFILAIGVAILANWVRVFILVLVAHYSQMKSSLLYEHGSFGWLVFGGFLLLYFYGASFYAEPKVSLKAAGRQGSLAINIPYRKMAVVSLFAVVVVSLLPLAVRWLSIQASPSVKVLSAHGGGSSYYIDNNKPFWRADYQGYDAVESKFINIDDREYEIVALTYFNQRQGKELIYYRNILAAEGRVDVFPQVIFEGAIKYNQAIVSTSDGRRMVWWFYLVAGQKTTSEVAAKLLQLPAVLTASPGASLITVSMRCDTALCSEELQALNAEPQHRDLLRELSAGL